MNILIPHKWLLEHLDTQANPKEIQEKVSLCGPSIERIYDIEGDSVYDIEVTTNRVDCMSIRGIAREAAVILKQFDIDAKLKKSEIPNNLPINVPESKRLPLPKITNDPKLSKRIICVVLKDVKPNPTPDWMGKRLLQTQQNIHDAVIDITNYVTHELGHPCHAFDYDKLMNTGGEIIIAEAKKGETFQTLDGNEFETVGGEVVFKNGDGDIIDLPSIKGTANTSIDDNTKNVLLLLESIEAQKVRFASMTHAIRTTAAQLMEKHVDPHLAKDVLIRGSRLYQELCDAQIASEIYDEFPGKASPNPVETKLSTIQEYLGIAISESEVIDILEQLECAISVSKKNDEIILSVTPPTFRPDLTIPADIVEEIARIYGYHKLPSVVMDTRLPLNPQAGVDFHLENRIKRFLSALGLQEIYSYSMVSEELAQEIDDLENHLKLQNPLTDDRVYLRKSLIPSLVEIIEQNSHEEKLNVFEIANVYLPKKNKLPNESLRLSIVSKDTAVTQLEHLRTIRGVLDALFELLFVDSIEVIQKTNSSGTVRAKIDKKTVELGTIRVTDSEYVAVELEYAKILEIAETHPTYKPIPKTAFITEDMTFTIKPKVRVGVLVTEILEQSSRITQVTLKDVYKRNYTFTITYHDPDKNLSSEGLKSVRKKIVHALEKQQAKLVGTI